MNDRNTNLADFTHGKFGIGVVAGLGREIEGDRQPCLTLGEVRPVELVGSAGGRMP